MVSRAWLASLAALAWACTAESMAVLPVRVLQATIEVDVPQIASGTAALGLFLAAALEDAKLEPSLFCTSAAMSWRCLKVVRIARRNASRLKIIMNGLKIYSYKFSTTE